MGTKLCGLFSLACFHKLAGICVLNTRRTRRLLDSQTVTKLIPSIQEFIAFLPKNVRHVAAVNLLDQLQASGQTKGLTYLATAGEGGSFYVNANGFFDARLGFEF